MGKLDNVHMKSFCIIYYNGKWIDHFLKLKTLIKNNKDVHLEKVIEYFKHK